MNISELEKDVYQQGEKPSSGFNTAAALKTLTERVEQLKNQWELCVRL